MDIKDNKFLSDNTALSDNLNDSTIASNNQILANNELNVETRGAVDAIFDNVLELICMPKEKFKQIKSGLIAKQIESCQIILERAKDIKDKFGIDITPPPLKFSIPFIKQAACEHEEDMYDVWAKLLVEAATEYNPILLQYVDILSKIGSNEAKLLKKIFYSQKYKGKGLLEIDYKKSQEKELFKEYNLISGISEGEDLYLNDPIPTDFEFIFPYYIEAEPKPNTEDSLQQNVIQNDFAQEVIASVNLLVQLNLIHKEYTVSHDRYDKGCYAIPKIGVLLTEFGYSMIDCLEGKYIKGNKR